MSVKDVTRLRKEGSLDRAYKMAQKDMSEDPNPWTYMSMFWVLRDYVQNVYIPANNTAQARVCLNQMERLLPEMMDESGIGKRAYEILYKRILPYAADIKTAYELSKTNPTEAYHNIVDKFGKDGSVLDPSLQEDFGWIIYRYLKANNDKLSYTQKSDLLRDYMLLENELPSLLHSVMLNYALNLSKNHKNFNFYSFFQLWGVNNLREDDFCNGYLDGRETPSLISRICRNIIDSGQKFNVSDFVGEFSDPDVVIDNLRQAYFWKLMNLHKDNQLSILWDSFDEYADQYSSLGASHWHSEVLKIANRFMVDEHSSRFYPFVMKWYGNGNFRKEDWQKEKGEEGKEFPSLAVKTAKKCYETVKAAMSNGKEIEQLNWLKDLFEEVVKHETEDDWSIRNYAIVCLWCGDIDQAIATYKSVLTHLGDKYYLWAELAECIRDDDQLRIGLLLKAKSIEKNEDFLGDIHLSLASLWQATGHGDLARQELEAYAKHYKEKGWKISNRFREISASVSCENKSEQVNFMDYIFKAEDYAYNEFDWVDFVLTEKWEHKDSQHCNFCNGDNLSFSVKTKRFPVLKESRVGDIIRFRCKIDEKLLPDPKYPSWEKRTIKETHIFPLVAKKSDREAWSLLPIKYGVIDHINESKGVIHILTQDSKPVFKNVKKNNLFAVDTFVRFREYEVKNKDESRVCVENVESCSSEEALPHMKSRVVVVDDVNDGKNLFHVVLGPRLISDIVRYDQTEIRPSVGDFLHITYCIRKDKEGKKRIKFLDIKKSDTECENVTKTISGRLELRYRYDWFDDDEKTEPDFALVGDNYVHRRILKKYGITSNCYVTAKVVLGGDNKWKVYELQVVN